MAAAALAVATDPSRDAALRQALLDRERAAMTAEDRGSFLAQRLYTGSTQVPSTMRPMTWRAAHQHVQNDVLGARRCSACYSPWQRRARGGPPDR